MSFGNVERLARDILLADQTILDEFNKDTILFTRPSSGTKHVTPYMVLRYVGTNKGPVEATMVTGVFDIDVVYSQKNYVKINLILDKLRTLLHGTRLVEVGYFAECSFDSTRIINITEIRKSVLGKTIRFEVHEAF